MSQTPKRPNRLLEYFKGLTVWGKIGWTIILGYIAGRIIYWLSHLI